jgi:mono/diheme cytochrome c family protein
MKWPGMWRGPSSTLLLLAGLTFPSMGCWQSMGYQPSYRPLTESEFFPDGRSSRPLEAGTMARRSLYVDDLQLDSGLKADVTDEVKGKARYFETFPFKLDEGDLKRGQERFNIYCSACHDRTATGHGIVVQRGFTQPPNLLEDESRGLKFQGEKVKLAEVPPGYIFEVITHGYGAMPSHGAQVPPRDRWNIIGYIRSLQTWWGRLTKEERDEILKSMPAVRGEKK